MGKKAHERRRRRRPEGLAVDPLLAEADRFLSEGTASGGEAPPPADAAAAPATAAPSAAEQPRLQVLVSADGMEATVRRLPPDASVEEVLSALEAAGVTEGVDLGAIRLARRTARESGRVVEGAVVARGTAPRPPGAPRLEPCPPPGLEELPVLDGVAQAQSLPDSRAVRRALKGLRGWLVPVGQVLAEVQAEAGSAGVTVRGEPVSPGPGPAGATRTEPGPGVALSPEMTQYTAGRSGYAGLLGGRPAVLAPVWVAPDGMEASFLTLRLLPGSATLSAEQVAAALAEAGVRVEANPVALASLVDLLAADQTRRGTHPLAVGVPPVPPRDAAPAFAFEHQARAGAVRADGTIDYRERNAIPAVHAGDLLVRCEPPVPGTPGRTVRGEEIPVQAPRGAELVAGDQVRREEKEGIQELYAEAGGGASVQTETVRGEGGELARYTVSVHPVAQVSGDVGYDTGHIEVPGSVTVAGSVRAGFRVRAEGDVAISGSVENGAQVEAGGSITVQQGILGTDTRIKAGGAVTAKFIQEATVEASGEVAAGSYIHNAEVQARGAVRVEGAGGAGGIVGGRVWGVKGVWTRNLGSASTRTTRIYAGIDPAAVAEIGTARLAVQRAEVLLQQLLQSVGLPSLKADEVRAAILRQPARKQAILHYVKKANQLAQARQQHAGRLAELVATAAQGTEAAFVDVAETAYAGVSVQIGNWRTVLTGDVKAVRLYAYAQGDQPGVRQRPLAEAAAS